MYASIEQTCRHSCFYEVSAGLRTARLINVKVSPLYVWNSDVLTSIVVVIRMTMPFHVRAMPLSNVLWYRSCIAPGALIESLDLPSSHSVSAQPWNLEAGVSWEVFA